ncbi:uncharacterized protein LOC143918622 [Arctopsyche grandis]|uniref:uncharacterized protein LOC143918622 n=1 Tax=Arctopsyche grandis TaxID=121162 RepID=UPI00406D6E17
MEDGLIRVGGRIQNSELAVETIHPIILPSNHPLTRLIIKNYHLRHLHLGTQSLLNILRLRYWPIAGKSTVKGVLRECMVCFRANPLIRQRMMGNLPTERVIASPPFTNTGLDFAGPLAIKSGTSRGSKIIKCYAAIFICMATKAIHLEVVGDLSTNSFLNCLKRFIARRGRPSIIFSDNATNFVGADRIIRQSISSVFTTSRSSEVLQYVASEGIEWSFIPPRTPHMGGLWESAVKQMKTHLRKILQAVPLTFEALATVITQIEACLNSRPLTPLSNDPIDFLPLTPGHFLIGRPLLALPNVKHVSSSNDSSHLLQIQRLTTSFWARWSADYLQTLQERAKWRDDKGANLEAGQLVLLREECLQPTRWVLGRVTQTFPGPDQRVRVVNVRTSRGVVRRSAHALAPLPSSTTSSPQEEQGRVPNQNQASFPS